MTYLDADDVASLLHLTNGESAMRLFRSGEIPAFKVGRQWLVDSDALAEWAEARTAAVDPHRIEPRSARSEAAIGRRRVPSGRPV